MTQEESEMHQILKFYFKHIMLANYSHSLLSRTTGSFYTTKYSYKRTL